MIQIDPTTKTARECYKIATGSILPRPIAWVSTLSKNGVPNLAPYSFFTVASSNPLRLLFCPQLANGATEKDTLANVKATQEFVINLTNERTAEAMNKSATGLPSDQSEFEYAGVTPAPSTTIKAPYVAEAPLAFECQLFDITYSGKGAVVIGTVTLIHADPAVYDSENGYINLQNLKPIGRLSSNDYCHINDLFQLIRE